MGSADGQFGGEWEIASWRALAGLLGQARVDSTILSVGNSIKQRLKNASSPIESLRSGR